MSLSAALLSMPAPFASAEPCPDVELIFARGSGEPPGVGGVGQAFVDRCARRTVVSRSRCIRSITRRAPTSTTQRRSPRASSTASGTQVVMSSRPRPTARTRRWSWAVTRRARRWRDSSPRPRCLRRAFCVRAPAVAACGDRPRLRGRSLRKAVRRVGDSIRRTTDRDRPSVCGEDHPVVRSGRHHLRRTPGGGPTAAHLLYPVNGMVGEAASFAAAKL